MLLGVLRCPDGQAADLVFVPQSPGSCWPGVRIVPHAMPCVVQHHHFSGKGGIEEKLELTPLSRCPQTHCNTCTACARKMKYTKCLMYKLACLLQHVSVSGAVRQLRCYLRRETGSQNTAPCCNRIMVDMGECCVSKPHMTAPPVYVACAPECSDLNKFRKTWEGFSIMPWHEHLKPTYDTIEVHYVY